MTIKTGEVDFAIKQGDRLPVLKGTCTGSNDVVADLTGATEVRFKMRPKKTSQLTPVIDQPAAVVDAAGGCGAICVGYW